MLRDVAKLFQVTNAKEFATIFLELHDDIGDTFEARAIFDQTILDRHKLNKISNLNYILSYGVWQTI